MPWNDEFYSVDQDLHWVELKLPLALAARLKRHAEWMGFDKLSDAVVDLLEEHLPKEVVLTGEVHKAIDLLNTVDGETGVSYSTEEVYGFYRVVADEVSG